MDEQKISLGRDVHVWHVGAGDDGQPAWVAGKVSKVLDAEAGRVRVHLFLPSGGVLQVQAVPADDSGDPALDSWRWPPRV